MLTFMCVPFKEGFYGDVLCDCFGMSQFWEYKYYLFYPFVTVRWYSYVITYQQNNLLLCFHFLFPMITPLYFRWFFFLVYKASLVSLLEELFKCVVPYVSLCYGMINKIIFYCDFIFFSLWFRHCILDDFFFPIFRASLVSLELDLSVWSPLESVFHFSQSINWIVTKQTFLVVWFFMLYVYLCPPKRCSKRVN